MNKELTDKVIEFGFKREDKRSIPLIVELADMTKYYSMDYLVDCMEKNYNGGKTYTERYGDQIEQFREINNIRKMG